MTRETQSSRPEGKPDRADPAEEVQAAERRADPPQDAAQRFRDWALI